MPAGGAGAAAGGLATKGARPTLHAARRKSDSPWAKARKVQPKVQAVVKIKQAGERRSELNEEAADCCTRRVLTPVNKWLKSTVWVQGHSAKIEGLRVTRVRTPKGFVQRMVTVSRDRTMRVWQLLVRRLARRARAPAAWMGRGCDGVRHG